MAWREEGTEGEAGCLHREAQGLVGIPELISELRAPINDVLNQKASTELFLLHTHTQVTPS